MRHGCDKEVRHSGRVTYEVWQPYETERSECTVHVKRHWDGGSSWRAIHQPTQCSFFLALNGLVSDSDAVLELFRLLDGSVARVTAALPHEDCLGNT